MFFYIWFVLFGTYLHGFELRIFKFIFPTAKQQKLAD